MFCFKECREAAGISQKAAAISLNVSAPSVSAWESGKNGPTLENLIAMAELYHVTTDELLGVDSSALSGLKRDERQILRLYREAEPTAREYARDMLASHPSKRKETFVSSAG